VAGPLILINVDAATARRARMEAQLAAQSLAHARIGCDFRKLARDAIVQWYARHFPTVRPIPGRLSGAELGCWASHLCAWLTILESGAAAGTVLEDDVLLAPAFGASVATLEADLGDLDLVYLGTSSRNVSQRRAVARGALTIHLPVGVVLNTWGYVVAARWIRRLFAQPPFELTMPVDHFLGGRARVARPRIGVLRPACVEEDPGTARQSQIAPHTWRLDRSRAVENARRRFLASRAGDWFHRICRWL
jgi:glycosyl transferase family 25